ncbi:MAG: Type IV leader peptidase family protein [Syntrophus sp. PtaB.Bin138]|jgi:prepilin peptidase CpaA|nr:MAG: Type IV leader peptidase family protein [Syntrophus sp. PtaB.Bin138]
MHGTVLVMSVALTVFLISLLLLASAFDLRQRRIPNALTFPAIAGGIIYWSYFNGLDGFMHGTGGLLMGIGFLIIFYLMGMMGAGDVKLMGAAGSILGPQGVFIAFLYSAIIGGLYALFVLARSKALKQTAGRYGLMARGYLGTGQSVHIPPKEGKLPPLCYGLAISIGTILSVLRPLY